MKLLYGYDAETENGLSHVSTLMSTLISIANTVPKDGWQECPKCKQKAVLFFGDPDGVHWCVMCQLKQDMLAIQFVGLDEA